MKDHLSAIRDLIPAHGVPVDLWAPEPDRDPPFLSVEAPSWAPDPSACICGRPHAMETPIRLRAVAGTPEGVAVMLRNARLALGDGAPTPLGVPGRRKVWLRWERSEFVGLDPDATIPGTNRHPAVGVDTYTLHSEPVA